MSVVDSWWQMLEALMLGYNLKSLPRLAATRQQLRDLEGKMKVSGNCK